MTKSDFIRSQPTNIPAAAVAAAAKKAGIDVSPAMVYVVRGRGIPTRGRGRPRKHPLPAESSGTPQWAKDVAAQRRASSASSCADALRAAIRLLEVERDAINANLELARRVLLLGGDAQ